MIIINPSKMIEEIYREPLIQKTLIDDKKKGGIFKRFVMYVGSKLFDN
jgi:hypothetical protein